MTTIRLLDTVEENCPECGCPVMIVDGAPEDTGKPDLEWSYWLLCLDLDNAGCVGSMPIPDRYTVESMG